MDDNYLIKFSFSDLEDFLLEAKQRIYFSYPSLHPEIVEKIKSMISIDENLDVKVIIDPSEQNFRNGYGDITAVYELKDTIAQIYEFKNNRVSFIIVDDKGYFLFPESRIFEEDGENVNAARLSKLEIIQIIKHFFPPKTKSEKDDFVNMIIDSDQEIKNELQNIVKNIDNFKQSQPIFELNEIELEATRSSLEQNPPLEPDIKRKIEVYTSKFQFVELTFSGVNFGNKKINIPVEVLPINDKNLKEILETKMKLFENFKSDSSLWKLKAINNKVEDLRNKYTVNLREYKKRVIKKIEKDKLLNGISNLQTDITSLKNNAEDLFNSELNKSRTSLIDTLKNYYKNNPREDLKNENDINDFVSYLIDQIDLPKASEFKNNICLECKFFEFTFEDLRKESVLKELKEKKVIETDDYNELVNIRSAFESKNDVIIQ